MPINIECLSRADFFDRTVRSFTDTYPRLADLFIFLLDNPRIWTQKTRSFQPKNARYDPNFQALIRVYLRSDCLLEKLKANKDAAAECPPVRIKPQAPLIAKNARLEIEKVSRVERGFRLEGQPKIREALRNENA